jgi:polysaccharide deacetylase family protein (PEP-CTERM system associated)
MKNALTIDIEDYFQVTDFDEIIPRSRWDSMESRVERNTGKVLRILDDRGVRATFFVLGWVAERYPGLVKEIASLGHEIGCHGRNHHQVFRMSPDGFRDDLRRSKRTLEDISGCSVVAFRAPSFSVSSKTPWVWPILCDEGFRIDSSIYPVHHDRYSNPDERRFIHVREDGERSIVEFPLMTLRFLGNNIPVAGGGYLRLFPVWFIERGIRTCNKRNYPGILYFHPWEIDPDQPKIAAGWRTRFRHYVNLGRTEAKIRRLLGRFPFAPLGEVVDEFLSESTA